MRTILVLLFALTAQSAFASIERSPSSKIKRITSYHNQDISIVLEENGDNCSGGYWIDETRPGYSSNLSLLISAYHAGLAITIRGYDDDLWSGSSNSYCRIYAVEYGYI